MSFTIYGVMRRGGVYSRPNILKSNIVATNYLDF